MTEMMVPNQTTLQQIRLQRLDILRAIVLIGMVIFHFSWDLNYFGYISQNSIADGWLVYLARFVAGSFLFLSGFSLYLAHGNGIKWQSFTKRFIVIVLAACLVSIVTYFVLPDNFIYFGILHEIALTSFVGLLFLRTPLLFNALVIIAVFYAPQFLPAVSSTFYLWLGLNPFPAASFDYVPFFPWFSAGLLGLTVARFMKLLNILDSLRPGIKPAFLSRLLQWSGRHTLLIYLLHQPILLAGFYAYSSVFPPSTMSIEQLRSNVEMDCRNACEFGKIECVIFCKCAFDEIDKADLLKPFLTGYIDVNDPRIDNIRKMCFMMDLAPRNLNP